MSQFIAQARQFWTWNHIMEVVGDIEHITSFVVTKIRFALKRALYWSAVVLVGLLVSSIILSIADISVVPQMVTGQEPSGLTKFFYGIMGNVIAWLLSTMIIMATVMAYIMQIVIGYPWSGFWTGEGAAQAGGFINVSGVVLGWKAVRDVCNLFFAVILLVIALATALNIEAYKWQEMLRKLILFAILINFSRTICGFFTDAASVAMATFGAAVFNNFTSAILGNFNLASLGALVDTVIPGAGNVSADAAAVADAKKDSLEQGGGVMYMLLAQILMGSVVMFFAFIIFLLFTIILIIRIVLIWLLIVLSPIAYVTRIIPNTQKYSQQWWETFGRWVLVGPFITFFLWLSIFLLSGTATSGTTSDGLGTAVSSGNPIAEGAAARTTTGNPLKDGLDVAGTEAGAKAAGQPGLPDTGTDAAALSPSFMSQVLLTLISLGAALQFSMGMASEAGQYLGQAQGAATSFARRRVGAMSRRGSAIFSNLRNGSYDAKKGIMGGGLQGIGGAGVSGLIAGSLAALSKGAFEADENKVSVLRGARNTLGYVGDLFANTAMNPEATIQGMVEKYGKADDLAAAKSDEAYRRDFIKFGESKEMGAGGVVARRFGRFAQELSGHGEQELADRSLFGVLMNLKNDFDEVFGRGLTDDVTQAKEKADKMEAARTEALLQDPEAKKAFEKNPEALAAMQGSETAEDALAALQGRNENEAVKAANAAAAAERANIAAIKDGKRDASLSRSDVRVSGIVEAQINAMRSVWDRAGREGDGAAQNHAMSAIQNLQNLGEDFSLGQLQDAIGAGGLTVGEKKRYGYGEEDDLMTQLKAASNDMRTESDKRLQNVVDNNPLVLGGNAIDRYALGRAIAQYKSGDKEVNDQRLQVRKLGAVLEAKRFGIAGSVEQASNAFIEEQNKGTAEKDFRDLAPTFLRAVQTGNGLAIQGILRRAMKEKSMGMINEWLQRLIDVDAGMAASVKAAIDARSNPNDPSMYDADFKRQLVTTDKDGKEVVRLVQGRELAEVIREVLLKGAGGMSQAGSYEFMNGLSGIAIANNDLPFMAMYDRHPTDGMKLNSAATQAFLAKLFAGSGRGIADLMRGQGINQMFTRDHNGDVTGLQSAFKEVLKGARQLLNDPRLAQRNLTPDFFQRVAADPKLFEEVFEALGRDNNHAVIAILRDYMAGGNGRRTGGKGGNGGPGSGGAPGGGGAPDREGPGGSGRDAGDGPDYTQDDDGEDMDDDKAA